LQIRQLQQELADLRRRVLALEPAQDTEASGTSAGLPAQEVTTVPSPGAGDGRLDAIPPLLGWAFLGLSVAYLLRAATESGKVPILAGVTAGIAYGGWWIFLAARRAWQSPVASSVHSMTALLILAPLLWEATVRFEALSASVASAVLVSFTVFALSIAWRHRISGIAVVATLGGLVTSTAVFRESHNAAAWTASVLAIAAAVELSACRDHWLGLRWAAALAADLTILILTMLALRSGTAVSAPVVVTGSLALAGQVALLCIYLASTADRTLIRKLRITGFEIGQAAAAFLTGIGGALYLQELTKIGSLPVGLFTLACSLACYAISYGVIAREAGQDRNFYAYSTFAAALMIVACRVLLPQGLVPAGWALLAVALAFAGFATGRLTLRTHAAVLLILATLTSGSMQWARAWIIQVQTPGVTGVDAGYTAVLAGSLLCYSAILLFRHKGVEASSVVAVVPAAISLWLASGLAAVFLSRLPVNVPLRTALMAAVALVAARIGVMTEHKELIWIAYVWVAAAAFKVFFEDFRLGESFGVFLSLTLFGATLILLPKILRGARRQHARALRAGA
jgi:hypothetical protein